jgi:hypothetical protein
VPQAWGIELVDLPRRIEMRAILEQALPGEPLYGFIADASSQDYSAGVRRKPKGITA